MAASENGIAMVERGTVAKCKWPKTAKQQSGFQPEQERQHG